MIDFFNTHLPDLNGCTILAAAPCPVWLSWLIDWDNPFCPVHKTKNIIKNAGIEEGMTVLDAGCGPGRVTVQLAKKIGVKGQVIALDIQSEMLKRAKEKVLEQEVANIIFLEAGLGENKLWKEMFDRALLVTVLGELPDPMAALKEIFNSLKPNGILSITEIIFDTDFQRQEKVLNLAISAGFRKKESFGTWLQFTINFEKP